MSYTFPGLWPFVERVARGRDLHHLGRARDLWHCRQVQDALGQLPRLDPASQRQLYAHVLKVRASMAVALEGVDAAILEVANELGLAEPRPEIQADTTTAPGGEKRARKAAAGR